MVKYENITDWQVKSCCMEHIRGMIGMCSVSVVLD